jgi:hypothetical protein
MDSISARFEIRKLVSTTRNADGFGTCESVELDETRKLILVACQARGGCASKAKQYRWALAQFRFGGWRISRETNLIYLPKYYIPRICDSEVLAELRLV